MEASEIVDHLEGQLNTMAAEGTGTVDIAALLRYLTDIRQSIPASTELMRLDSQLKVEHYKAVELHSVEMFRSVIEAGGEALRSLVLISGGGVVALMGFIGAVLSRTGAASPSLGLTLSDSLRLFGFAVLMGALGFGGRYLSQVAYTEKKYKLGVSITCLVVALALAGYVLFGCGVWLAHSAFTAYFAKP